MAYIIIDRNKVSTSYIDVTVKLVLYSSSGYTYALIAYHYDANCIVTKPLKDRKVTSIMNTWKYIRSTFQVSAAVLNTYVLDNEVSSEFIEASK